MRPWQRPLVESFSVSSSHNVITFEYLLTSIVVILIPGAGVLYTLAIGLASGKRASVFAALGCTMGITPSLLASVFGLAAIFHASSLAFQIVKYAGVAYLLFLAWQIWRSAPPALTKQPKPAISLYAVAAKGFLINILNPKLSIFFPAFLPQFIAPNAAQPLIDMLLLGLIFVAFRTIVNVFVEELRFIFVPLVHDLAWGSAV